MNTALAAIVGAVLTASPTPNQLDSRPPEPQPAVADEPTPAVRVRPIPPGTLVSGPEQWPPPGMHPPRFRGYGLAASGAGLGFVGLGMSVARIVTVAMVESDIADSDTTVGLVQGFAVRPLQLSLLAIGAQQLARHHAHDDPRPRVTRGMIVAGIALSLTGVTAILATPPYYPYPPAHFVDDRDTLVGVIAGREIATSLIAAGLGLVTYAHHYRAWRKRGKWLRSRPPGT